MSMITPTRSGTASALRWRGLLMFCAAATLVATIALQAAGRFVGFPSLVIVDLAMAVGLLLLGSAGRRRRRSGAVVVGLFSLLNNIHAGLFLAVVTAPAADPVQFVTCSVTWAASLLAIPVSVAAWRSPGGGSGSAGVVRRVFVGLTAVAVVLGAVLYLIPAGDDPQPGDLRVSRERTGWGLFTDQAGRVMAPTSLVASPGVVTVAVSNTDPLVGASFEIDELDVHVRIPPGTTARVSFEAPVGSYRFYDNTFLADGTLEVR